ncbi:MAG: hypothetical protein MZW92_26665 [Comamonadaceae bacterium]|nr:hypothetical protein [Comamonadaceae bacterium]
MQVRLHPDDAAAGSQKSSRWVATTSRFGRIVEGIRTTEPRRLLVNAYRIVADRCPAVEKRLGTVISTVLGDEREHHAKRT